MVIKTEIDSISPHLVDAIKLISKAITGTHASFRKAVVEWMLCEDHPPRLAKYVAPHDNMVTGSDCQLAIIDQGRMSQDGWGGDKEIIALATMFQVDICVSTNSCGGRRWHVYIWDENKCRGKSDTCITQIMVILLFPQRNENVYMYGTIYTSTRAQIAIDWDCLCVCVCVCVCVFGEL